MDFRVFFLFDFDSFGFANKIKMMTSDEAEECFRFDFLDKGNSHVKYPHGHGEDGQR